MEFLSLNKIFENRLFRIPDYQRGYAWRSDENKEVVAFWNDLINLPEGKSHFTGSLTLQEMTDKEQLGTDKWLTSSLDFSPWYVVDGQQRLTTIMIFLQCIYEFLDGFSDEQEFLELSIAEIKQTIRDKYICRKNIRGITSYLFGYINNSASDNYLRREVFNDLNYITNEKSYYTLNIKKAKDFFKKNIKEYYDKWADLEAIGTLYNKLTKQLRFQLIEVKQSDEFNIFVAFETINNRGRQLSNLEKLKNRLIYLTTLYKDDYTHIREEINRAWKEVYNQIGRNANHLSNGKVAVLDDDEFLKTHWILYYQYSRKTGYDYIDYLLGKKFTVQNVLPNLAKTESTQELVKDDEEDAADTIDQDSATILEEVSLKPVEISDYVKDMQNTAKMWYYTWFPQDAKDEELSSEEINMMERINRLGIAYFRPLITALFFERLVNKKVDKDVCLGLLNAIERFIFIEFRLQLTRSNYGSSEFNRVARDLHKGKKTVNDIIRMVEERINRSFEIDEATGQKVFKTRNMQVMVDKLFEQKDDERAGYYRWSAIHYFLYEYNANLINEGYHGSSVTWDSFKQSEKDKISIEHIFPHTVTTYWSNMFDSIPETEWSIYQGSLGNLLLLSQKINAQLQNDDFDIKKNGRQDNDENKRRSGYSKGSYSELEVSSNYSDWTPTAIKKRGLKMLNFLEKHWNLRFKSEEDKKKLLLPGIY